MSVYTNPDADDAEAAFAAGFLEGHATANRIEQAAVNAGVDVFNMSAGLGEFLSANARYTEAMEGLGPSLPQRSADRRIWYHSGLVQRQLDGLHAGYLKGRMQMPEGERVTADALTAQQLLLLNIGGDLEDLDGVGTCNMSVSAQHGLRGALLDAPPRSVLSLCFALSSCISSLQLELISASGVALVAGMQCTSIPVFYCTMR